MDFLVSAGSHSFSMVFTFLPFPKMTGSRLQKDFFWTISSSTAMVLCSLLYAFFGWLLRTVGLIRYRVVLLMSTEDLFFLRIYSQMMLRYYLRERRWLSSMGIFTFDSEGISSFLLQKSARQGWARICSMAIRLSGSNSIILPMRSRQSSLACGTNSRLLHFLIFPITLNTSWPVVSRRCSMSFSEGGPVHASTFSSWFMVDVPGKRGLPFCISASMHPILQMSIARLYFREPNKIYGARYQRVAMYYVRTSWGSSGPSSSDLTSPKSQSLASQFSFTSTLEGLMSLWMSPPECRKYSALAIWQKMYFLCLSARISSRMRVNRSMSMCSKTRQISRLFSARMTSSSLMTLGWASSIRNMISRQVRCASVELLNASKFFLRAFIRLVFLSVTFQTWPQAPLPIFLWMSNRARMCVYIYSLINIIYIGKLSATQEEQNLAE